MMKFAEYGLAMPARWTSVILSACYILLLCATGVAQKGAITPSMIPEQPDPCEANVVVVASGNAVPILFEPALQAEPGEQLVYETLSGQFLFSSPSQVVYMPICAGWDFVQIRAVDGAGHSRVVARIDFMVDDESQLLTTYDLTVEVEGRGYLLPLNAGGVQYAAIWLSEINSQAPGRPGRGGRLCLKRPDPPPGINCASLPPEGIWVCPPYNSAGTYCTGLTTCEYRMGEVVATLCGEEAARLRAELGLQRGCIRIGGQFEICVVANGCVTITSLTITRVQCQQCTTLKKQYCRRFCCRNGVVECCEQHLYTQNCHFRRIWLPPPAGPINTPEACDPISGPFTQPGCDW